MVAHADADAGEVDALLALAAHPLEDLRRRGHSRVGDAVRQEDDPVVGALEVAPRRHLVAQAEPGVDVGVLVRVQRPDGVEDPLPLGRRRGLEHRPGLAVESDDTHAVALVELRHEEAQPVLHELQAILAAHGAGGIHDEDQGAGLPLFLRDLPRLDADLEEQVARFVGEGARGDLGVDREGGAPRRRLEATREVVDELLGADGLRGRQEPPAHQVVPHERVTRGVDVDGERGEASGEVIRPGVDKRVVAPEAEEHHVRRLPGTAVELREDVVHQDPRVHGAPARAGRDGRGFGRAPAQTSGHLSLPVGAVRLARAGQPGVSRRLDAQRVGGGGRGGGQGQPLGPQTIEP